MVKAAEHRETRHLTHGKQSMPYSHRELIERSLKLLADIRKFERQNRMYLEPRIYVASACEALIAISMQHPAQDE